MAEKNLEEAKKVKETLDKDQAVFLVLATKCCSVYFALQSLPRLNPLYRFSLQTFVAIYRKAVQNLAKDDHVKDQLQKFCAVAFYQVRRSKASKPNQNADRVSEIWLKKASWVLRADRNNWSAPPATIIWTL